MAEQRRSWHDDRGVCFFCRHPKFLHAQPGGCLEDDCYCLHCWPWVAYDRRLRWLAASGVLRAPRRVNRR